MLNSDRMQTCLYLKISLDLRNKVKTLVVFLAVNENSLARNVNWKQEYEGNSIQTYREIFLKQRQA
jgi:hypothetical protein